MGKVIPFPLERRLAQISAVRGVAATGGAVSGGMVVTYTGISGGVEMVAPSGAVVIPESWWKRVPSVQRVTLWAKVGFAPARHAKKHRVVNVVVTRLGLRDCLVATTACGRRAPLSQQFDAKSHGGECLICHRSRV